MLSAEVRLWGRIIGSVLAEDGSDLATFQYTPEFVKSGIQVSPIVMPLRNTIYRFPELSRTTFHGLPGLLADSLPDKFGNAVINAWLEEQGRALGSVNAVERLCYTGSRGMGALEFVPSTGPATNSAQPVDVGNLVQLASEVLHQRENLKGSFNKNLTQNALIDILRVGTSAGGARAKAVIAWNPDTNEVKSGQVKVGEGFEYWLLKFDGVDDNKDKELNDPQGYGAIEYAYYLMAIEAGIKMSECRLLQEKGRRHFMTKRFDRTPDGGKLHMQSLCGLAHYDFNEAGAYSYEQALLTLRRLNLPMADIEEQYRRMVFNILARNQDDHVKNIAFLMDRKGIWSLAPAFDMTYSYNPSGSWTSTHQMTMNNKRDKFTMDDFKECAKVISLKRGRENSIIDEVREAVKKWNGFAEAAAVAENWRKDIKRNLRLKLISV